MQIEIASDHRGYELKREIIRWLQERGYSVRDWGCSGSDSCDYPDYAYPAARAVAAAPGSLGVLLCSNGIGMSMIGNKVPGIRAALCVTVAMASQSRRHNNANVIALGADNLSQDENIQILESWLAAEFEAGRHCQRVEKIMAGECLAGSGRAPAGTDSEGGTLDE